MIGTKELLRDQVAVYERHAQPWKEAHHAAMECRDLEELLAFGAFLFRQISRVDEQWHERLFRGELCHNPDMDRDIHDLYRAWAVPSEACVAQIEHFEAGGFTVEGAKEFRECVAEVRGVLLPDAHFFTAQALHNLRDAAIDDHQRGETVELRSLSD